MMALALALVGSLGILVIGVLASKWLNIERDRVKFNRQKMAAVRASKKATGAPGDGSLAPPDAYPLWLVDLLENLGYDIDILGSDDAPDELARFMPFVQSFVDSGGLDKLKASGEFSAPGDDFGAI